MMNTRDAYQHYVAHVPDDRVPVHKSRFYVFVREGVIPGGRKKGHSWLVPSGAVERFARTHTGGSPRKPGGKPRGRRRKDGSAPVQRTLDEIRNGILTGVKSTKSTKRRASRRSNGRPTVDKEVLRGLVHMVKDEPIQVTIDLLREIERSLGYDLSSVTFADLA